MNQRKALVIYNPSSGSIQDMDHCIGAIVHSLCKEANYSVTVITTTPNMNHQECAALIPDNLDLVVAAGGDGTIRLVLGAVSERAPRVPVALMPLGTGNQLARNLGLYEPNLLSDPLSASIDVMLHGRAVPIDIGVMNGEYFCVAAGAGPLSDAVIAPSSQDKSNLGMLAYVTSIIQTFALPPVVFHIKTGNDDFQVTASGIFVTNVADLGVGTLSDSAEVRDGLLDLCIMKPNQFGEYLQLGFRFTGGLLGGEAPYYIRKVSAVDIEVVPIESELSDFQSMAHKVRSALAGQPELPPKYDQVTAMIDGDAWGTTPMHIEVRKEAVLVLTKSN